MLPDSTYLITRRCTQRQFLLKPSALTNGIIAYCLGWAANTTGVTIHAICAMSNHLHVVATDPEARLPEFLHLAHLYIAKCLNASYGRWENLWASEPPSAVRLVDDDDVLDKIAYCLANPVSAGLVREGRLWPGLRTQPSDFVAADDCLRPVAASATSWARPTVFFREDGPMPEQVTLRIHRPNIYLDLSDTQLCELLAATVDAHEARARADVAQHGRSFAGADAVLAQRVTDTPQTVEPRRKLAPRVAARDKWRRIEALGRLVDFQRDYRLAYQRFSAGLHDTTFPAGTYALRVRHGVCCDTS